MALFYLMVWVGVKGFVPKLLEEPLKEIKTKD
jgi:hypothetical protein